MKFMNQLFYAPDSDGGAPATAADATNDTAVTDPQGQEPGGEEEETAVTFDTWLTAQDEQVQTLINDHLGGLSNALKAERAERKTLTKQLRDVTAKLEDGSDLKNQLDRVSSDFDSLERQASFYEDAHAAGVTNLRLAWLAAQDGGLVSKTGTVDIDKLKLQAPELFKKMTIPTGNAGNGRVHNPQPDDMNQIIRRAAGRT